MIAREGEGAADVDHADDFVARGVVEDGVAGADLYGIAGAGDAVLGPGVGVGPFAIVGRVEGEDHVLLGECGWRTGAEKKLNHREHREHREERRQSLWGTISMCSVV